MAYMPGIGRTPSLAMAGEDVRHLQIRHGRVGYVEALSSIFRVSSGLSTCRMVLGATRT